MKSIPVIIAVDFDSTIAITERFPNIKGLRKGAKKYINKLVEQGYHITIWTCRTDKGECVDASMARKFLNAEGVMFHEFNSNHRALNNFYGNDSRKVAADMYVDDKGLWLFGIPSWFWLYWIIRFKAFFLKERRKLLSICKPEHFL